VKAAEVKELARIFRRDSAEGFREVAAGAPPPLPKLDKSSARPSKTKVEMTKIIMAFHSRPIFSP